ncbi:MAG: flagellar type III secretion system pore protein FliP [Planctomycetes bacterium]|nr:flagellar type III secretion system pore protein FliP [Planctomycetota bacterium]
MVLALLFSTFAFAAPASEPAAASSTDTSQALPVANTLKPLQIDNPITIVQDAADSVPGFSGGLSATINIILLMTVLSLAPAILILCTCFTRIIVVLALLRQAIGTQALPPSQILIGLGLFMTMLIMAPTFTQINRVAITPLSNGQIDQMTAWVRAKQPLRDFMFDQIERSGNWGDVYMVLNYRGVDTARPEKLTRADVDMITLIPAFILSELKTAFLIGFRIYLPFLIIDMVIASLLISMGMLMLPPVLISLPFKLLLFVLVDGWRLIVGNLLDSFAVHGGGVGF